MSRSLPPALRAQYAPVVCAACSTLMPAFHAAHVGPPGYVCYPCLARVAGYADERQVAERYHGQTLQELSPVARFQVFSCHIPRQISPSDFAVALERAIHEQEAAQTLAMLLDNSLH